MFQLILLLERILTELNLEEEEIIEEGNEEEDGDVPDFAKDIKQTLLDKQDEIGVEVATSTKAMEVLNKVYGVSIHRVDDISRELKDFAENIGLSASRVLSDLAATAPGLAQWGDEAIEIFMDLERVSKATGVEIGVGHRRGQFARVAGGREVLRLT